MQYVCNVCNVNRVTPALLIWSTPLMKDERDWLYINQQGNEGEEKLAPKLHSTNIYLLFPLILYWKQVGHSSSFVRVCVMLMIIILNSEMVGTQDFGPKTVFLNNQKLGYDTFFRDCIKINKIYLFLNCSQLHSFYPYFVVNLCSSYFFGKIIYLLK